MNTTPASKDKLIQVGKVVDAKGLKGELKVLFFAGEASWKKKVKTIYLQKADGEDPQPFHLLSLVPEGERFIARVKDVTDRTAAEKLKGSMVLIPETAFATTKGEAVYLREIQGFSLIVGGRVRGVITGFDSNVAQDLLIVELRDDADTGASGHANHQVEDTAPATALVPLIKEFIVRIDHDARTVEMNLPEGLLEVNTQAPTPDDAEPGDGGDSE